MIEITNHNRDKLILKNFLSYSEDDFECEIIASSRGFSYSGNFFMRNINKNILELENMYNRLNGETIIKEDFIDSRYIKLTMQKLGHLLVELHIEDYEKKNIIHISFESDQTVLSKLITFFKELLENNVHNRG